MYGDETKSIQTATISTEEKKKLETTAQQSRLLTTLVNDALEDKGFKRKSNEHRTPSSSRRYGEPKTKEHFGGPRKPFRQPDFHHLTSVEDEAVVGAEAGAEAHQLPEAGVKFTGRLPRASLTITTTSTGEKQEVMPFATSKSRKGRATKRTSTQVGPTPTAHCMECNGSERENDCNTRATHSKLQRRSKTKSSIEKETDDSLATTSSQTVRSRPLRSVSRPEGPAQFREQGRHAQGNVGPILHAHPEGGLQARMERRRADPARSQDVPAREGEGGSIRRRTQEADLGGTMYFDGLQDGPTHDGERVCTPGLHGTSSHKVAINLQLEGDEPFLSRTDIQDDRCGSLEGHDLQRHVHGYGTHTCTSRCTRTAGVS